MAVLVLSSAEGAGDGLAGSDHFLLVGHHTAHGGELARRWAAGGRWHPAADASVILSS